VKSGIHVFDTCIDTCTLVLQNIPLKAHSSRKQNNPYSGADVSKMMSPYNDSLVYLYRLHPFLVANASIDPSPRGHQGHMTPFSYQHYNSQTQTNTSTKSSYHSHLGTIFCDGSIDTKDQIHTQCWAFLRRFGQIFQRNEVMEFIITRLW
jgi:hypothetical protein